MKKIEEMAAKCAKQGIASVELDVEIREVMNLKTTPSGAPAITEEDKCFLKSWVNLVLDQVYDHIQVSGEERDLIDTSILIDCTTNKVHVSSSYSCIPEAYSDGDEMEWKLDEI